MDRNGEFDMSPFHREGKGLHKQPLPQLRPAVHEMIGRRLRLHYGELQEQPLPGRLVELLRELDEPREEPAAPRRS